MSSYIFVSAWMSQGDDNDRQSGLVVCTGVGANTSEFCLRATGDQAAGLDQSKALFGHLAGWEHHQFAFG